MKSLQNILNLIKDKGVPTIARQLAREKLATVMSEKYDLPAAQASQLLVTPNGSITKQIVSDENDRFYLQMQRGFFFQLLAEAAHKRFRTFAPIKAASIAVILAMFASIVIAARGDDKDVMLISYLCGAMLVLPLVLKIVVVVVGFISSMLNGSFSINANKKESDSKETSKKEATRTALTTSNSFYDFYFYLLIPKRLVSLILPTASDYNKSKRDSIEYFDDMFNEDYNELASEDVNHRYSKESNPVNKAGVALNTKFLASDALYGKLGTVLSESAIRFFSAVKNQFLFYTIILLYIAHLQTDNLVSKGFLFCLVSAFLVGLGVLYALLISINDARKSPLFDRDALASKVEKNTGCTDLVVAAREELKIADAGLAQRIEISASEDQSKNIAIGASKCIADTAFNMPFGVDFGKTVYVEPQSWNEHVIMLGQPGAGKTVLSKLVAEYCAKNGWGGLYLCGKNGQLAIDLAKIIKRLTILTPKNSIINPIENLTPDEVANTIIDASNNSQADAAGKSVQSDQFFLVQGKNLVRSGVLLLDIAQYLKLGVSFDDILDLFDNKSVLPNPVKAATAFPENLIFVQDKLPKIHDTDDSLYRCIYSLYLVLANPMFAYILVRKLQNIIKNQPERLADIEDKNKCDVGLMIQTLVYATADDEIGNGQGAGVRATVENGLSKIIQDPALAAWTTAKTGIQIEDVQFGKQIGIVIGKEYGSAGAVLSMFIKERAYSALRNRGNFKDLDSTHTPVEIMIDEWQSIIASSDNDMLAKARSAGVGCYYITQSINSIIAKVGEHEARAAFGNCGTKLLFKMDNDTAEFAAKYLGDSYKLKTKGHVSMGYRHDLRLIEASGGLDFGNKFISNTEQRTLNAMDFVAANKGKGEFEFEKSPNATASTLQNYLGVKFMMMIVGTRCGAPLIEIVDTTPDFAKRGKKALNGVYSKNYVIQ